MLSLYHGESGDASPPGSRMWQAVAETGCGLSLTTKYTAIQIAREILRRCDMRINNLKLQNLLYFAWIAYKKATGDDLFAESFYALQFGPAVPEVYYKYCAYGGMDIDAADIACNAEIDRHTCRMLDDVISKYARMPVRDLVGLTRAKGTPWYRTYIEQRRVGREMEMGM